MFGKKSKNDQILVRPIVRANAIPFSIWAPSTTSSNLIMPESANNVSARRTKKPVPNISPDIPTITPPTKSPFEKDADEIISFVSQKGFNEPKLEVKENIDPNVEVVPPAVPESAEPESTITTTSPVIDLLKLSRNDSNELSPVLGVDNDVIAEQLSQVEQISIAVTAKTPAPEEVEKHFDLSQVFEERELELTQIVSEKSIGKLIHKHNGDIMLADEIKFGRHLENADYAIETNKKVSGVHFRVFKKGDHYLVEDLNSTNGTRINGIKLSPFTPKELEPGDIITAGGEIFTYELDKT